MKKLLVSAAIVTGLIAPAIYATVSGGDVTKSAPSYQTSEKQIRPVSCMRKTMSEYSTKKKELGVSHRSRMREAMAKSLSSVSGEKQIAEKEIKELQNKYAKSLLDLRQKYMEKQRSCNQK